MRLLSDTVGLFGSDKVVGAEVELELLLVPFDNGFRLSGRFDWLGASAEDS